MLRALFFGGLATTAAGATATLVNFLYPRPQSGPKSVRIPRSQIPQPGTDPAFNKPFAFFLVNLNSEEAVTGTREGDLHAGLLALSNKCPHQPDRSCPVEWAPDSESYIPWIENVYMGSFECPCHGSKFTKAGARVFGPAPHSLSTMRIEPRANGDIDVFFADVSKKGVDSDARPLAWP